MVAASGVSKKELADKPISHDLETAIANRQTVAINRAGGGKIVAVTDEEDITGYTAQVVSPIIADGEAIGAVLLLSKEQGAKMGDAELKVAGNRRRHRGPPDGAVTPAQRRRPLRPQRTSLPCETAAMRL